MGERKAAIERKTRETDIKAVLTIDGAGLSEIGTGIGFFDHMLEGFAKHGFFNLTLSCKGDLNVDCHHTMEDCGIVLGTALNLSSRPYLVFEDRFTTEKIGDMDTEMVREFFYAVSYSAGMNLHLKVLNSGNNHHIAEAMFKAFGRALDEACSTDPRIQGILSTKGSL